MNQASCVTSQTRVWIWVKPTVTPPTTAFTLQAVIFTVQLLCAAISF